jgi:hypothetical protein
MIRNSQDPARQETLRNRTRSCSQGLDVRNSSPSNAQGEVFLLDIPFYRTRPGHPSKFNFKGRATRPKYVILRLAHPAKAHELYESREKAQQHPNPSTDGADCSQL